MERENYVESLKTMIKSLYVPEENETLVGNSRTVATQTNPGIWLESKGSRKRRRSVDDANVSNVKGTVYVDGSNLISDGTGRYFMEVELNNVRPLRSMSNQHSNGHGYSNQRVFPSRGSYNRHDSDRSSKAYYSNQNTSYRSNYYRSNGPNGTYFSGQTPYSSGRSYGMHQQDVYGDLSDPFET